MSGKCVFNQLWLKNKDYLFVESVTGDKHRARCKFCANNIDIEKMGESALKSHMKASSLRPPLSGESSSENVAVLSKSERSSSVSSAGSVSTTYFVSSDGLCDVIPATPANTLRTRSPVDWSSGYPEEEFTGSPDKDSTDFPQKDSTDDSPEKDSTYLDMKEDKKASIKILQPNKESPPKAESDPRTALLQQFSKRAKDAEFKLVEFKRISCLKMIEEKVSDGVEWMKVLDDLIALQERNNVNATNLYALSKQIRQYMTKLHAIRSEFLISINEQIISIESGMPLDALKELEMPELPAIPSWTSLQSMQNLPLLNKKLGATEDAAKEAEKGGCAGGVGGDSSKQEGDKSCMICFEEMTPRTAYRVDCGHTFHLSPLLNKKLGATEDAAKEAEKGGCAGGVGGDSSKQEGDKSCMICFEEMTPRTAYRVDCGHTFHLSCIQEWINKKSD